MASIQEMLTDSLRDMLDAERQAVKSLPKMVKAASSPELKQAFQEHIEVTRGQIARLEQVFEILGERAKPKPCAAMQGLVEEAIQHISEHERGDELDAVLIASGQKMEHYEISAYGTARAMARASGHRDAASLLQETLKEEEATDKLLTKVALNVYREMVRAEGESEEGVEEEARMTSRGRGARGASANGRRSSAAGRPTSAASRGAGASRRGASVAGRAPVAPARGASRRGAAKKKVDARGASRGGNGAESARRVRGGRAGSSVTTDHDQIRHWAEERGAHPACVRGTGDQGDIGMLRLDFPGFSGGESLEEISWDDFFNKFDERGLALLYQDQTARGQKSNFNKLVSRETAQGAASGGRRRARQGSRA